MSHARKVKILQVSPDVALRWLENTNNHNRPVRDRVVAKFSEAMKRNEWKLTSEPIAFSRPYVDSSGKQQGETLLNGQHRLWAVVESKCTVPFTVWWGCEPDEFEVIDQGATRTFGDILATTRGDLRDHTLIAGVSTSFIRFGLGFRMRAEHPEWQLRPEHIRLLLNNAETDVLAVVAYKKRLTRFASRPIQSAILLAQMVNPSMTELIVSQLKDATGFSERDPIRALHLRLVEQLTNNTQRDTEDVLHYKACHALAARLRGEHLKTLRITPEGLAWLRDAARAKIHPLVGQLYGGRVPVNFYTPKMIMPGAEAAA